MMIPIARAEGLKHVFAPTKAPRMKFWVQIKRSVKGRNSSISSENCSITLKTLKPPVVRKRKLVIVDLDGSERIHKSGSEGHTLEVVYSLILLPISWCIFRLEYVSLLHTPLSVLGYN